MKSLKVPMTFLRRINIPVNIYLDNLLLMGQALENILMARDLLIFLLQNLRFGVNLQKAALDPVKQMELCDMCIDSK